MHPLLEEKRVLSRFSLNHYFEVIVSGYEVNHSKPHTDIFLKTAEKLGITTKECIVIENSRNGVRAAKAAGDFTEGGRMNEGLLS